MARTLSVKAGGILSYFVRHRTVANLLLILLLAAGAFSIPNMRAQFFPDVVVDDVDVSVMWDGAGAASNARVPLARGRPCKSC